MLDWLIDTFIHSVISFIQSLVVRVGFLGVWKWCPKNCFIYKECSFSIPNFVILCLQVIVSTLNRIVPVTVLWDSLFVIVHVWKPFFQILLHESVEHFTLLPVACSLSVSFILRIQSQALLKSTKILIIMSHLWKESLNFWLSLVICWKIEQYLLKHACASDGRFWVSRYQLVMH